MPFAGAFLIPVFRGTTMAGFLKRRTGATPDPAGSQFCRNFFFHDAFGRVLKFMIIYAGTCGIGYVL
jgi:hypothetical protein